MVGRRDEEQLVGLETRDVFVDTEVYRRCDHNVNAKLMTILGEYVKDGIFVLHTTDITLREVRRQVQAKERELRRRADGMARDLRRWNTRYRRKESHLPVPDVLGEATDPSAAYRDLEWTIRREWDAQEHRAAELKVGPVLDRYFDRKAPFDSEGSKEFPDALALFALEHWCARLARRMYVVSNDGGVLRAARDSEHFIAMDGLDGLFGLVVSAGTHDVAEKVDVALADDSTLIGLRETLNDGLGEVGWLYQGDRTDGDVLDAVIEDLTEIGEVRILRVDLDHVACIVEVELSVSAQVEYADLELAWWDKEDQRYYGEEYVTTEIEENVGTRIFVELKREGDDVTLSSAGFLKDELSILDRDADEYPYK